MKSRRSGSRARPRRAAGGSPRLVLGVVLLVLLAAPARGQGRGPVVEVEAAEVSAGEVLRGEVAEGTFVLRNAGDELLKVLGVRPG